MDTYNQTQYAKLKGVTQQYVSKLVKQDKLIMIANPKTKKWEIVDCEDNDKMFKKSK